mmetsp:Transcript_60573/g.177098  ORF Transcript_60573/g.177098 Transcript_60573/m.177098 type:complete len:113 (-) Transcript_60573:19-357(-)
MLPPPGACYAALDDAVGFYAGDLPPRSTPSPASWAENGGQHQSVCRVARSILFELSLMTACACFGPMRFHLRTSFFESLFVGFGIRVDLRTNLMGTPLMRNSSRMAFCSCRM